MALGMRYVLDVPAGFTVWPVEPERTSPVYRGRGGPPKPRLVAGQRRTMGERSAELPAEAWREITVAEGSQGPRSYEFSAQRVRPTSRRKPDDIHWAIYRRNLDGSEPATTCPTHRRILPWRLWPTWAVPGGPLNRSSRRKRAMWAWTNTRPGVGPAGITT